MNEEQQINVEKQEVQQEPKKEKLFTEQEVNEFLSKRIGKEKAKLEQQFNDRLSALEEAQKLSQMSEKEKAEHEYNKRIQALEEREKAIQEKEDAYSKQQYHNEIVNQLQSKGLPTEMADLLVGFDAETVASKIAVMEQSFNNQLNATVESKIKSSASIPTVSNQTEKLLSLEEIQGLSMGEYQAHKDLVEKSLKSIYKK